MEISTLSLEGCTVIIKNVSPNEYIYGSVYYLEQYYNEQWTPYPVLDGNYVWPSETRILNGNSVTELEIDWTGLYGELHFQWTYRIVKNFAYSNSSITNGEYYPAYAEFTIHYPPGVL